MRIDFINFLIAIGIAALLAWGGYSMTKVDDLKAYVALVSFVTICTSGVLTIAMGFEEKRSTVVVRATSGAFFLIFILLNGIFTFFDFSKPLYIILNVLLLLLQLIIIKGVVKSKM